MKTGGGLALVAHELDCLVVGARNALVVHTTHGIAAGTLWINRCWRIPDFVLPTRGHHLQKKVNRHVEDVSRCFKSVPSDFAAVHYRCARHAGGADRMACRGRHRKRQLS